MFKGSSRNTVDTKGRFTVPVRWRGGLNENLVIMYGLSDKAEDRFLQLMNLETFDTKFGDIASSSMYDSEFARAKRFILSNAEDVTLDKSDRLLIPQHLIQYADLGSEVLLFGVGDLIEIWNPEQYAVNHEDYNVATYSADSAKLRLQKEAEAARTRG